MQHIQLDKLPREQAEVVGQPAAAGTQHGASGRYFLEMDVRALQRNKQPFGQYWQLVPICFQNTLKTIK